MREEIFCRVKKVFDATADADYISYARFSSDAVFDFYLSPSAVRVVLYLP